MPVAIKMPDLGTAVDEVRLVKWLVGEGASVRRGDLIAEIETDKATSELESIADGVLLKHVVPEGTAVAGGGLIAYIGKAGEAIEEAPPPASPSPQPAPRISPMVRNLAEKLGVDLAGIKGTGIGGAITREDVQQAAKSKKAPESVSRSQAAVARAVTASAKEIPQFGVRAAIDMTAAEELRRKLQVGYDALFLKAMAIAAEESPVHIALAMDVNNTLLLPVLRDVGSKGLSAIQSEVEVLEKKAQTGALPPDAMTGASMSLSNLGMYPVESFDAIIFPGHRAILAVGRTEKRAVVVDDRIEIRRMATVHYSADHRTINGRAAAEFVTRLKQALESGALGEEK